MSGVGTTAVGGIVGHGVAVGASVAADALPQAAKITPNMQKQIAFAKNFMLFHLCKKRHSQGQLRPLPLICTG
jgi:hypothetical protein